MDTAPELRKAAQRYRNLAKAIIDERTAGALTELAGEYDRRAAELEAREPCEPDFDE
jgi:hypothetical protein